MSRDDRSHRKGHVRHRPIESIGTVEQRVHGARTSQVLLVLFAVGCGAYAVVSFAESQEPVFLAPALAGLVAVALLVWDRRRPTILEIGSEGIVLWGTRRRPRIFLWHECGPFEIARNGEYGPAITFRYLLDDDDTADSRQRIPRRTWLPTLEGDLEDLAQTLNRLRRRRIGLGDPEWVNRELTFGGWRHLGWVSWTLVVGCALVAVATVLTLISR